MVNRRPRDFPILPKCSVVAASKMPRSAFSRAPSRILTVSESLWGCLLQADEWRTIEFLISIILSLVTEVQLGFLVEVLCYGFSRSAFLFGEGGKQTEDCDRDEE